MARMPQPLLTREAIRDLQLGKLRRLIGALGDNRFYAPKLREADIDAGLPDIDTFTRRMPLTTKQQLVEDQQQHPPFGTNLTFDLTRYRRFCQTSGTTRQPMRWLDTLEDWQWMLDCWQHVYDAADVTADDRVMCCFSFGPFLGFWTAYESAQQRGCLVIPGGGMGTLARLQVMQATSATVVCCTPTYAIRLGEVAREQHLGDQLGVRVLIVAGEPGASIPSTRAHIAALWPHARIVDHHGMTEIGPVTYECPKREGVLHVIETEYLAEVLDPVTHEPVEPGALGELVLTNLGRVGSPLLRYRTGDLVRAGEGDVCICGRYELALAGGILGRADDMIIVRGVNLYPGAIEQVVRSFVEVAEYRVQITRHRAMGELELVVEPRSDVRDPERLQAELAAALRETFGLRVPVRMVEPDALPRFEMKAQRWVTADHALE